MSELDTYKIVEIAETSRDGVTEAMRSDRGDAVRRETCRRWEEIWLAARREAARMPHGEVGLA